MCLALAASARAQAVDDGAMLAPGQTVVGFAYSHDTWDEYWEGPLKRDNQNIGRLTTRANGSFAAYGVTDRVTVIGAIPHVSTSASRGVLHGMAGIQDLSLAAKYRLLEYPRTSVGTLRAIAVGSAALPMTDYTPDFYPLSIGSASARVAGRFTVSVTPRPGWNVTGSTAYTWRAGVTLDRPYYFTDGRLFLTDRVDMPNVADYTASAGYGRGEWLAVVALTQQYTLGGGDIRRQDMPFVSNRMNATRVGGLVSVPVPTVRDLAVQFSYAYTVAGRNVGQSTTLTTGLVYRLGNPTP